MYIIREVMRCKPGKVRDMVNKFKGLSGIMQKMGLNGFRVLTDVSGEPFWTVIAEIEVDNLNDFVALEEKVMANDDARKLMGGYHELVDSGRREIFKAES